MYYHYNIKEYELNYIFTITSEFYAFMFLTMPISILLLMLEDLSLTFLVSYV